MGPSRASAAAVRRQQPTRHGAAPALDSDQGQHWSVSGRSIAAAVLVAVVAAAIGCTWVNSLSLGGQAKHGDADIVPLAVSVEKTTTDGAGSARCDADKLITWLQGHGAIIHPALRIRSIAPMDDGTLTQETGADGHVSATARGVFAANVIHPREKLFSVPDSLCLTAADTWRRAHIDPAAVAPPPRSLRTAYVVSVHLNVSP